MSEFDDQYSGSTPYVASDFQREDYNLDYGQWSDTEYRETENQLMGWGVQSNNLPTASSSAGSGGVNDSVNSIEDALAIYDSIDYYKSTGDLNSYVTSGQYNKDVAGYISQQDAANQVGQGSYGSSGGSSGGSYSAGYDGPIFDRPNLELEEFKSGAVLDLPDYEPPEYDKGYERQAREEFIQTYKGDLSEAARDAIMSSMSMDNPQARGKIIEAALEGYGDALKETALAGSQEGRNAANEQYGRDINVYNTQFEVASQEIIAKYNQQLQEDMLNWEIRNKEKEASYNIDLANYMAMPITARGESEGIDSGSLSSLLSRYQI
jgi:hypothetical protein